MFRLGMVNVHLWHLEAAVTRNTTEDEENEFFKLKVTTF
jgi:hypothetical protein